jgi:hypothetical protein
MVYSPFDALGRMTGLPPFFFITQKMLWGDCSLLFMEGNNPFFLPACSQRDLEYRQRELD